MFRKSIIIFSCIFGSNLHQMLHSQVLVPDETYGNSGSVRAFTGKGESHGYVFFHEPDGRVRIGGLVAGSNGDDYTGMAAFDTEGLPDSTFGTDGLTELKTGEMGGAFCGSKAKNGGYFLGGICSSGPALVKLRPDGKPDSAFGTNGYFLANFPGAYTRAIAEMNDGKVYLICNEQISYSADRMILLQLSPNGTQTKSAFYRYASGLGDFPIYASTMLVQDQAHFLVAGYYYDSKPKMFLACYDTSGTLNKAFGDTGYSHINGTLGKILDLNAADSGKFLASGWYTESVLKPDMYITKSKPDGNADLHWGIGGTRIIRVGNGFDYGLTCRLLDSGEYLFLGITQDVSGAFYTVVVKLDPLGNFYFGFGNKNNKWIHHYSNRDDEPWSIATDTKGRVYLGGTYFQFSTLSDFYCSRWTINWGAGLRHMTEVKALVYPNPGNGQFHISLPFETANGSRVVLRDQTGRICHEQELQAGVEVVTIQAGTALSNGLYYLELSSGNHLCKQTVSIIRD